MTAHADKALGGKSNTATHHAPKPQGGKATPRFADNRSTAVAQRKMQADINESPRVKQLQAAQERINNSPRTQQLRAQQVTDDRAAATHPPATSAGAGATPVQLRQDSGLETVEGKPAPLQKKKNNTGLPDQLKAGVENLSGLSMDDVRVRYNSDKPAELQAHAYAQGTDIHLAPGQEEHLPHEAWHVVQQQQGRVKRTMQLKGKVAVNDDAGLEKEADVMGAKAVQLKKAQNHHPKKSAALASAGHRAASNGPRASSAPVQRVIVEGGTKYEKSTLITILNNPTIKAKIAAVVVRIKAGIG